MKSTIQTTRCVYGVTLNKSIKVYLFSSNILNVHTFFDIYGFMRTNFVLNKMCQQMPIYRHIYMYKI